MDKNADTIDEASANADAFVESAIQARRMKPSETEAFWAKIEAEERKQESKTRGDIQ